MHGTSVALFQNGRPSVTITLEELNPQSLGALIALFERAVGLYASMIGINAYHQPSVDAGKSAARDVIELSLRIQSQLKSHPEQQFSAASIANILAQQTETVTIFKLLEHLAANGRVQKIQTSTPFSAEFQANP
jgi:glucose-6-phosphate isomerase